MGRASSIAKVVGINVAGLALALVGAEIALRIVKPEALQARLKMNELMRQCPPKRKGYLTKHSTSNPTVRGSNCTANTNIRFSTIATAGETPALTSLSQLLPLSLATVTPTEYRQRR